MTSIRKRAAGPVFVGAGLLHFLAPKTYQAIMPDYMPAHRELVYASGIAEAAGGVALMSPSPRVRRAGAWWLVATLIAILPANVHMALHPERYPKLPKAGLWARVPLQIVFMRWVLDAARR